MKSRNKGFLCMGMLLLLTLVIAGCGDKKESNIKVGNEVYSLGKEKDTKEEEAKKNESEQKTYAVIEIDTEKQLIRLQNTKSGKISDYGYSDGTEFRDKYGGLTGVEKMLPGRIVKIGETRENGAVSLIQLSDEAWEQENVERFSMKQDQQMITVGKTKYYYDDSLLVFLDAEQITLDDITENDVLRVSGVDKKIVAISVTSGHGFLTFTNTDLFEGGWLSIGNEAFLKVSKDMKVEVPQGTYKLSVAKDGYGDTKEITVNKNETTVVDLNEYQGSGPSYCRIQFQIKPEGAVLTLNGEVVDATQPMDLKYGVYRIGITAEGYDDFNEKLMVSSKEAVISIDLDAVAAEKEEEEKSSSSQTTSSSTSSTNSSSSGSGTSSSSKSTGTSGTSSSDSKKTEDSSNEETSSYKKVSDLLSTLLD